MKIFPMKILFTEAESIVCLPLSSSRSTLIAVLAYDVHGCQAGFRLSGSTIRYPAPSKSSYKLGYPLNEPRPSPDDQP